MIYTVSNVGWTVAFDDPADDYAEIIEEVHHRGRIVRRGVLVQTMELVRLDAPQAAVRWWTEEWWLRAELGDDGPERIQTLLEAADETEPRRFTPAEIISLEQAKTRGRPRSSAPAGVVPDYVRRELGVPPGTRDLHIYIVSIRGRTFAFADAAVDIDALEDRLAATGRFTARALRLRYDRMLNIDVAADDVWWFMDESMWPQPGFDWP